MRGTAVQGSGRLSRTTACGQARRRSTDERPPCVRPAEHRLAVRRACLLGRVRVEPEHQRVQVAQAVPHDLVADQCRGRLHIERDGVPDFEPAGTCDRHEDAGLERSALVAKEKASAVGLAHPADTVGRLCDSRRHRRPGSGRQAERARRTERRREALIERSEPSLDERHNRARLFGLAPDFLDGGQRRFDESSTGPAHGEKRNTFVRRSIDADQKLAFEHAVRIALKWLIGINEGLELERGTGLLAHAHDTRKSDEAARRIRERVRKIQATIDEVRRQRALRREARNAVPLGTIALVGYTNAGKSTLFNALSRAEVLVSPKMFATLDPTIRAIRLLSNRRVLLADTVGFIRDLPKGLLTAFRATLEEVQEAALILHVSDVSNPHYEELDEDVEKILRELDVADRPRLRVLNKADRLSREERKSLESSAAKAGDNAPVLVSALTGEGIAELLCRMDTAMPGDPLLMLSIRLPLAEGRILALIHALGRVVHSEIDDSHIRLDADEVIREVEGNGFRLLSRADHVPGSQYIAVFAKSR